MLLDRSYFALQAKFATRIAEIEGLPFAGACRLHTAFYLLARDNDVGVPPERRDFDPCHKDWVAFVEAIENGEDPVDYVYAGYLAGDAQEDHGSPCFTFAHWPEEQLVRIHFANNVDVPTSGVEAGGIHH